MISHKNHTLILDSYIFVDKYNLSALVYCFVYFEVTAEAAQVDLIDFDSMCVDIQGSIACQLLVFFEFH